ncbi:MAG TPA: SHOCT domain-containing protein [Ottowia sp.]|uniref:SHOCT domain-containing protein n=1 Tax=Ottowia sp. TaxID=1898956 RepID=UPI002CB55AF8|nr:SHOCT domain-containing protein [Ottowia sp.]HMN20708.1 SHOCT domain-containing protein [Ottowia sp.]
MTLEQILNLGLLALPAVIPIVVLLLVWRKLATALQLQRALLPRAGWKLRLIVLAGVSLFIGLMIATAAGAIHPPIVAPGARLVCDGAVEMRSQAYSYKPGQRGVSHTITCAAPDGSQQEITLSAILASTLLYGGGLFTVLLLWSGLRRTLRSAAVQDPTGAPGMVRDFSSFDAGGRATTRTTVSVDGVRQLDPQALGELGRLVRQNLGDALGARVEQALASAARQGAGAPVVVPDDAPPSDSRSTAGRLRELKRLLDEGLVSASEYEAKKAEILARL